MMKTGQSGPGDTPWCFDCGRLSDGDADDGDPLCRDCARRRIDREIDADVIRREIEQEKPR